MYLDTSLELMLSQTSLLFALFHTRIGWEKAGNINVNKEESDKRCCVFMHAHKHEHRELAKAFSLFIQDLPKQLCCLILQHEQEIFY